MWKSTLGVAAVGLFALAQALAQSSQGPRRPRGIYAVVNLSEAVNQETKANPSITPAALDAYLANLYAGLLGNPAISGLTLQVHWNMLNPRAPSDPNPYDWSTVDAAFDSARVWSGQNPAQAPKTIQLIVTPGFQSPKWVLDQIPSCDGLFQAPPQTPPSTCGKATFAGYTEAGDSTDLPLPWNPFYKASWKTFLAALAAQYGSNPEFVSIAVAGPTAASAEMLLPNNGNTPPQTQFGGILPQDMWLKLLAFAYAGQPAYQKSDQAFIDEWNAAIDMYASLFSGITLVATTGDGLPNLSGTGFTVPSAFAFDCKTANMDCAAETTILTHFVDPTVGGANAKATQESGLEASRGLNPGNLGVGGVKQLALNTAQLTSASAQILSGSQFNTSFSNFTLQEGCTSTFPPNANDKPVGCNVPPTCTTQSCLPVACIPQACLAPGVTQADLTSYGTYANVLGRDLISPEQAAYNVLNVYFNGTPAAASFGGTAGAAPLNYLQIYSPDIQYATAHANAPAQVVMAGGTSTPVTAQDLLNLASEKLLAIGEPQPVISLVANAEGDAPVIAPNTWVEIKGTNLASEGDSRIWGAADFVSSQMPTALDGVSVTVNGKNAFVYYISPTQVSILTPPDALPGTAVVQVTNNSLTSAGFSATAQALSPSFFIFNGGPYVIATHLDGSLVGPTSLYPGLTTPAKPGETVVMYANGFGPTSAGVTSGSRIQSGTLTPIPMLTIGGIPATVQFAGLVAPGEFQFNVVIPLNAPSGDDVIIATYNGTTTASNRITVQGSTVPSVHVPCCAERQ